jgi:tRNA modification GTPase
MSARSPSALPEHAIAQAPRVRDDTIVATATAPGRGAVALLRVSGPLVVQICCRVVSPDTTWPLRPRRATRCRIHEPDDRDAVLDQGLVTFFPSPQSYTGEHVVELGTHGGGYVSQAVCAALVEAGARPAEPGEFTERAVLNGKFDLLRAEAIADLIEARSGAMHRAAIKQLSGALSTRLAKLRETVIEIEALIAYEIDFPEEDSGLLPRVRILEVSDWLIVELDALLATVHSAILGQEGAIVVLAGAPNVGKSSLFNALAGEARVIVSEVPGTTRDAVEVLLDHDPWPIRLVDTAGLRDYADPVEGLGIEVSKRYLARAHVVIVCAESVDALLRTVQTVREWTQAPVVGAFTKADLVPQNQETIGVPFPVARVSAIRGDGLHTLLAHVTTAIAGTGGVVDPDTPVITRARHRAALSQARHELVAFRQLWAARALPAPVAAVHVRAAGAFLDELIGVVDIEDVFARVFATFCIGK